MVAYKITATSRNRSSASYIGNHSNEPTASSSSDALPVRSTDTAKRAFSPRSTAKCRRIAARTADGSSTPLHSGQSNTKAGITLPQGAVTVMCEIENSVGAVTKYSMQGSFAPSSGTVADGLDALSLAALAGNADYSIVSFTAGVVVDRRRALSGAVPAAAAAARALAAGDANKLYDALMAAAAADVITSASVAGPVSALGSVMTLAGTLSPDRIEGGLTKLEAWSVIAAQSRITSALAAAFVAVQSAYATHVPAAYSAPGRCSAEAHLAAILREGDRLGQASAALRREGGAAAPLPALAVRALHRQIRARWVAEAPP